MSTTDGVNHNTKIVMEQGGAVEDVESGGAINVKSGGIINFESGSQLQIDGVDKADVLTNAIQGSAAGKMFNAATHTVTAGEDTANSVTIATDLTTIAAAIVQVIRSGAVVTGDAAVSFTAGDLTVADGSTFVLTTGDVINWMAFGV